ncbi:hypothetical protein AXG93_4123s1150 [Marchantia polymorpha subsp. ruderalis]|nr:hypothetical protein AXG93_4123s1150 [Marchantia polymorpha subsp. ruderalis]
MKFLVVFIATLVVLAPWSLASLVQDVSADDAEVLQSVRLLTSVERRSNGANEFVLVHGASHGAWCWYKVVTMLETKGYKVTAVDLTSLGRSKVSADSVTSMVQYVKPAVDHITNASSKVILVGHSAAGTVLGYIMELMPEKIEKGVFLVANMPAFGILNSTTYASPNMSSVADFTYANGPSAPPTSILFKPDYARQRYYNQSPKRDVTLALSLLSPQPLTPLVGVFNFTPERYGSVRRFYIQTLNDNTSPAAFQEGIVKANPPERHFKIDSDHSAFFSKPSEVTCILEEIYHS